jgi:hypothetical protein
MWRLFRGSEPLVLLAGTALLAALLVTAAAEAEDGHVWNAGAYSFSDELGGFRILGASGTGRKDDPFIIREEFTTASPATMVIRATMPIRPFDQSGVFASGFMHFRIMVLNNSGQPWIEFEFELQELRGLPSLFGDGLSFDQRQEESGISSDSFASYDRDFEPYDRLVFRNGKVDPLTKVGFSFLVTDYTPKSQFYLVQDPRIPSS